MIKSVLLGAKFAESSEKSAIPYKAIGFFFLFERYRNLSQQKNGRSFMKTKILFSNHFESAC